ncbi:MAG TPA: thiamine pyrophosphate-binding protein [Bacteroidetes bacterium]|nr:thiamine pyrophosphate-binding protein [Bacteroidota bacterium]
MTVAEYIAKKFKERGVRYVFGIPGGPSIPYMEEFNKHGIEFILTTNETAAGVMADITGRLTGIPGICHATFGPGATNLSTGIGGAMLDRSPVIALTSVLPETMRKRTAQMNIDHQLVFEPVTKATVIVDNKNISEVLTDAFELATDEYPGPVHIGLPSDQALLKTQEKIRRPDGRVNNRELLIDDELIELLEYSSKPLLVLGLTAVRSGIKDEINDFLAKHRIPLIVTPMAKGLVDENHDCYCGVLFHAASDRLSPVINEADLVIGLGYDPVEYNYESWLPDVPLIHFNTVFTDMPEKLMVRQIIGSLQGLLSMIDPVIKSPGEWDPIFISECRENIQSLVRKDYKKFGPVKAMNILRETLPANIIMCLDVGSHIHLFGQYWRTGKEGRILMTNGWSSMGFGIPAAIAAALNEPDAPVACVTGDGGFLMMCGEVVTARRLNLGVLFIVLCDRELNLIKIKEERKGIEKIGVDLYDGSLIGEKTFLGVPVRTSDNEESLRRILSGIYPLEGPVIIEINIDPSEYNDLIIT